GLDRGMGQVKLKDQRRRALPGDFADGTGPRAGERTCPQRFHGNTLGQLSSAEMTTRDGNGWTRCGRGHRHWGRHGAAGLLLAANDEYGRSAPTRAGGGPADTSLVVLLQQRSWWGSYGGSWGPPGGARDSHESAVRAALREAIEECAIDPRPIRVHGVLIDDHGGWTYQTVLASA